MWIKICGITRLEDAVSAARFGADAVGFVFADGPGRVTPGRAREIAGSMPAGRSTAMNRFLTRNGGPPTMTACRTFRARKYLILRALVRGSRRRA